MRKRLFISLLGTAVVVCAFAGIDFTDGFRLFNTDPIDYRFNKTRIEMRDTLDACMPDVYFTICKDDGMLYLYNKTNTVDDVLGKYRLYSNVSTNGVVLGSNKLSFDDNDFRLSETNGQVSVEYSRPYLRVEVDPVSGDERVFVEIKE